MARPRTALDFGRTKPARLSGSGRSTVLAERHAADFALAKTPDEVQRAIEADWPSIFVVSDGSIEACSRARSTARLIAVPQKYDYLARR